VSGSARIALAAAAILSAGCTEDAPSMIPVDVSATIPLRQVTCKVEQGGEAIQTDRYDWGRASDSVLRIAVLLPPRISGEILLEVSGTTPEDRSTPTRSHRLQVTPGQVAATVRVVLLPPPP